MRIAVALVLITALAGALRFDAAASPNRYQSVDERAYGRLARALATKGNYGDPRIMSDPVRWPPGAPLVFGLAHQLWPGETRGVPLDVPAAYPVQALAGTALVPAVFALAALVAGPVAGLVAAAAVAVYPPLVTASGDLLTEPLGALALAVALVAVVLALRRPGPWRGALSGVLLGLAVLVRADLVLLPFGLAVVVALVLRSRRGMLTAAALAAAAAVTLTPWSIYASGVAGRFVPVSSGGASNLFVGTYLPGDGTMFGLKRALGFPPTVRQQFVIDRVAREHAEPGDSRDDALRAAAADNVQRYVIGDPLGFAGLALRKVDRLWLGYTRGTAGTERASITAYHLLLVAVGMLGLLAGLVRTRGRAPALWVIAAVVAYVSAVNVVLVSEARHNLPIMPVLVAGGVAGFFGVWKRASASGQPLWPSVRLGRRVPTSAGRP